MAQGARCLSKMDYASPSKNYFVDVKLADDLRQTFTNPNFGSFFRGKEKTFDDTAGEGLFQGAVNVLSNVQGASKLFQKLRILQQPLVEIFLVQCIS